MTNKSCGRGHAFMWRSLLIHLVPAGLSFSLLVVIPIFIVIIGVMVDNDPGGPMFLPMFLMLTVFFAAALTGVFFAIAICLQALRKWIAFPRWLPLFVLFPVYATPVALLWCDVENPAAFWLIVMAASALIFSVYWGTLLLTELHLS